MQILRFCRTIEKEFNKEISNSKDLQRYLKGRFHWKIKTFWNVVVCLLAIFFYFFCPKMFLHFSAASPALFWPIWSAVTHNPCAVIPHLCAVTTHPISYSTVVVELHHMDGELQHIGWVVTAHRLGQNKCPK